MANRFVARDGEVWDETALPYHKLDLDDARALVQVWAGKANECRATRSYAQARCWSIPANDLRSAISQAEMQRRLNPIMTGGSRPPGWKPLG